jgi:hypothetical protein
MSVSAAALMVLLGCVYDCSNSCVGSSSGSSSSNKAVEQVSEELIDAGKSCCAVPYAISSV